MAYTLQGNDKDCLIVSVCNLTGKDYDDVLLAAAKYAGLTIHHINHSGTPIDRIPLILLGVTGKVWTCVKPRRGQDKLTGIASWHRPGRKNGHATCILDGFVFDTNGKTYSIDEYRLRHNFVLRGCYIES